MAHGLSCSAACGIFPDQGSNPCPLHWQADSSPLHHQGSSPFRQLDPVTPAETGEAEFEPSVLGGLCKQHWVWPKLSSVVVAAVFITQDPGEAMAVTHRRVVSLQKCPSGLGSGFRKQLAQNCPFLAPFYPTFQQE